MIPLFICYWLRCIALVCLLCTNVGWLYAEGDLHRLSSREDLIALWNMTAEQLSIRVAAALTQGRAFLAQIVQIPASERTFENTVRAFDYLRELSDVSLLNNVASVLEKVHPRKQVRAHAAAALAQIADFFIDEVSLNPALYEALKEYVATCQEPLSAEQQYVLDGFMKGYEQSGFHLPEVQQQQIRALCKELHALSLTFARQIAQDQRYVLATAEELAGVDSELIAQLPQVEEQYYRVGVDYPTYVAVMTTCTVEATRKRLAHAFHNRAYPENELVLQRLLAVRDELAELLGFQSYAHGELSQNMAGSPERAEQFLRELLVKAQRKELEELTDMLETVTERKDEEPLRMRGEYPALAHWNLPFLKEAYKRAQEELDEQQLSAYFPMESTIARLFDLYRGFFGVDFVEMPLSGLWDDEVRLIEVYTADRRQLLGYLLLDLHPRPHKYTHACHRTVIPSCSRPGVDMLFPAVSIVIANFPRPTTQRPALWHRVHDVETFFHEFGHALHAILGRTELASASGTQVVRDFVEMPSQMLEEWLYNPEVLKRVSCHYLTGEPLSDELITRIQKSRVLSSGSWIRGQIAYALLALAYHEAGREKDLYGIMRRIQQETAPHIIYDPDHHPYTAFGHLTSYGAQYYGYLWSKVYAVDLFDEIERAGLFDSEIGARYVRDIISKGGGDDPNNLLRVFLGREPTQAAFLERYGLEDSEAAQQKEADHKKYG